MCDCQFRTQHACTNSPGACMHNCLPLLSKVQCIYKCLERSNLLQQQLMFQLIVWYSRRPGALHVPPSIFQNRWLSKAETCAWSMQHGGAKRLPAGKKSALHAHHLIFKHTDWHLIVFGVWMFLRLQHVQIFGGERI
jgi:hypothetical protein